MNHDGCPIEFIVGAPHNSHYSHYSHYSQPFSPHPSFPQFLDITKTFALSANGAAPYQ